jgi:two-component system cell cycle response regulator
MGERLSILCLASGPTVLMIRDLTRRSSLKGSRIYHSPTLKEANLTRRYDLIISEFSEGLEAITILKQTYPEAPILFYGSDMTLADQAIALGAQDFLPKDQMDAFLFSRIIHFALEREEHTSKLREKVFTDDLTGIYNRRGFITLMQKQMDYAKRTQEGFVLFLFDLDKFKEINDEHGHLVGDEALILTAQLLQKVFRSHDIVGRIGGDEFAVLALNAHPDSIDIFKNHLFQRFKELNKGTLPFKLSCSIGCTYYKGESLTLKELIDIADKDLYKQKKKHHYFLSGDVDKM